ncbi:SDR family NAD(P)-dependent oxidoreductase [Polymorphospora rubra]|uniref:SDR family NAD(P)-dependent oxidoreductase n=1 Tax=Polymorphospora rubra TaxID=338584 RepID=UPI0033C3951D
MRILVTGASTGLGLASARALATDGHQVVIHVRDATRSVPGHGEWAGVVGCDLSDLEQIRAVVTQSDAYGAFDAVIHNAGTMSPTDVFAVNTVAPFVLTALMDKPARLIYLSSSMHRGGSADLGRIDRGQVTYSDSKLYVTALAAAFATRWEGTVAHAVDPGWVPTRMGGAAAPDDLTAGHETQVWLATHDAIPPTGGYWHHRETQRPHPATQDPAFQHELISLLEARTGVRLD